MNTVIIGAAGQLGSDLRTLLPEAIALGHADLDISNAHDTQQKLSDIAPQLVINAAAYNKVDQAEDEPTIAWETNALGPRNLAIACASLNATLVHISTDYVFGLETSSERPRKESDVATPISAYGTGKLAGECFVRSLCPQHFVLRTCGLYGVAALAGAGKGNFVETMLRLGKERDSLTIVDDQHCTPTASRDLAEWIVELTATNAYGLYHATNSGATTWCGLAKEVFRQAGVSVNVEAIPSSGYPTKARRPPFSVLDNSKLSGTLNRPLDHWQTALQRYLQDREAHCDK